nr:hypothetical protein [Tanacetum cinerariifolium]
MSQQLPRPKGRDRAENEPKGENEPSPQPKGFMSETSNKPTQAKCNEFEELYAIANEELYPEFFQNVFPTSQGYKLPPSYYAIEKTFKMIRLRWKDNNTPGKKVPKKVFRYFSIIPRLQRLYKSSHTVKEITWHATGKCTKPGKMQHPIDGRAWKNFNTKKCSKPQATYSFTLETEKKFCQLIKGVKLPDGFGSNFKHKVTNNDTNITSLKSHDCHIMMQRLLPDGLQQYLPDEVAKPIIELCSFFKKICSASLIEDDMLKAQSKVVDIMCNLEPIYPPAFFDIMIHLVIHLHLEALEGGPIHSRWMYPFERFMKKLKNYVQNKAKPKGSIKEGYVVEEALTFNKDQDVSASSELFALACGPTPTPISVNSCVVNSVRFVVHSHDERRTSQNDDIFSPDGKDEEMYYGQLQEILEILYLLFKVVLFQVKWFDTSNEGRRVQNYVIRNNTTQIWAKDSDDEDLVNVDDDDDGHGGNGGGDDRRPPYQVPTGCESCLGMGTRKSNLGGRKAGRLHTSQETRDLGLKKITDVHGPVPIRFEWNDRETLMPLGDHVTHWANYLGELVRELPMYYPVWC